MNSWNVQKYSYVPGRSNTRANVCPGESESEPAERSLNVTVCGPPSSLLQVMLSPALIVIAPGANAKFVIETFPARFAGAACTTTLRGALPTAIVSTFCEAKSTTERSFDPSLVTYAVLPSLDTLIQCGCLPTAMLRTGLFVTGSNTSNSPGPCTTAMPSVMPANKLA